MRFWSKITAVDFDLIDTLVNKMSQCAQKSGLKIRCVSPDNEVNFIVPVCSYSAGTIFCMGAGNILMDYFLLRLFE